jgi:hypothetical protein
MKEVFTHERALRGRRDRRGGGGRVGRRRLELEIATGPNEYLLGEETALLEAINGRAPFPRLAPPFRHGAEEVGHDVPSPAGAQLATETDATAASPTLVNNVETLANVPGIVANGAGLVPGPRHRRVARHRGLHGLGPGRAGRRGRGRAGHPAAPR